MKQDADKRISKTNKTERQKWGKMTDRNEEIVQYFMKREKQAHQVGKINLQFCTFFDRGR